MDQIYQNFPLSQNQRNSICSEHSPLQKPGVSESYNRENPDIDVTIARGKQKFAMNHAWANKIGKDDPAQAPYLCQCCRKNISKKEFDIGCTNDDLAALGLGYPLFFSMSKHFVFLLAVIWFANGFYTFSTNVAGTDCKKMDRIVALNTNECYWNYYTFWSIANKRHSLINNVGQTLFDLFSFGALLVAL
jgi:hypothetical protein